MTEVYCIANEGEGSLTVGRVYQTIPDDDAEREGFLRVVDDSGEDYLYPAHLFEAR